MADRILPAALHGRKPDLAGGSAVSAVAAGGQYVQASGATVSTLAASGIEQATSRPCSATAHTAAWPIEAE